MASCPVCEHPRPQPKFTLQDRYFETTEDRFELLECPGCELLFMDESLVKDRIGDFYPTGYWWQKETAGRLARLEEAYRDWMVRHDQLSFLGSITAAPQETRLLDIGCGNGTFLKEALAAGYDAYGLEQSPQACALAEGVAPGRVFQTSEADLIGQGELFDVVTMFHTLEHVPSPFKYLKQVQKLMRKPAKLVVQVPNRRSWQARMMGRRWYGLDCPRHLYNYNTYALLHLLGRAGFRIHRLRHFSLRDNAAALASSLAPALDPMSQRVKQIRRHGREKPLAATVRAGLYFPLVLACQPFAWLESRFGRGGSVTVYASLEERTI